MLDIGRARLHRALAGHRRSVAVDPPWVEPLWQLIQQHPTFGYRHLWAMLRGQTSPRVNKKAVYRVLRQKKWLGPVNTNDHGYAILRSWNSPTPSIVTSNDVCQHHAGT